MHAEEEAGWAVQVEGYCPLLEAQAFTWVRRCRCVPICTPADVPRVSALSASRHQGQSSWERAHVTYSGWEKELQSESPGVRPSWQGISHSFPEGSTASTKHGTYG